MRARFLHSICSSRRTSLHWDIVLLKYYQSPFIQCTRYAPPITSSLISKISARFSFRAHGTAHVHLLFNIAWKKKTLVQPAQIGNELLSMTFPSLHLLFCQADSLDVLICNFELFWQEQSYNRGASWWTSIFTVSPSRLDRRLKYKNKFQPRITQGWCWIALFLAKLLRSSLVNILTVLSLICIWIKMKYSHIA